MAAQRCVFARLQEKVPRRKYGASCRQETNVGANMLQASFTGFRPLAKILKAMGVGPGEAFK